jgi:hypothetical protein
MGISVGVYFSMQQYTLLYPRRQMIVFIGSDAIGDKITDGNFVIVKR